MSFWIRLPVLAAVLIVSATSVGAQQACVVDPESARAPQWDRVPIDAAKPQPAPPLQQACRTLALYEWWNTQAWVPGSRRTPLDADGGSSGVVIESHDGSGWGNSTRGAYRYEGANAMEYFSERWVNEEWSKDSRILYGYEEGAAASRVRQLWSYGTTWVNRSRESRTYDAVGRIVEFLEEGWSLSGEQWTPSTRTVYRYDEQGRLAETELQEWAPSGWAIRSSEVFGYDDGALATVVHRIRRSHDDPEQQPRARDVYRYDDRGALVEQVHQSGNGTFWADASRDIYTYDDAGRLVEHTFQYTEGDGWGEAESQEVYAYSEDGTLSEYVSRTQSGGSLRNSTRRRYEYARSTSAAPPANPAGLHLAVQNPLASDGRVRYRIGRRAPVRLGVHDALGREVAVLDQGERLPGTHEAMLRTGGLAPGVYLLRLRAGGDVHVRTLTVVR